MNVVVAFSGGLDSTVLLYDQIAAGYGVRAVTVHYGQRHAFREVRAAKDTTAELRIPHDVFDLTELLPIICDGALGGGQEVPEGHYANDSMRATVVPNRNMMLLAVCGMVAVAKGNDAVVYGAHAGDHTIYPDCRPEFVEAMRSALGLASFEPLGLHAPFLRRTKADIVCLGAELKVPLGRTWSCYKGNRLHCGKCGTCVERIEAFKIAGIEDPTEYEHA